MKQPSVSRWTLPKLYPHMLVNLPLRHYPHIDPSDLLTSTRLPAVQYFMKTTKSGLQSDHTASTSSSSCRPLLEKGKSQKVIYMERSHEYGAARVGRVP